MHSTDVIIVRQQCLVVQSIDSLTSLLMISSFTVVAKYFQTHKYFCCKNVSSFCDAKATHNFFSKKYQCICNISERNLNVTLADNFVKF